MSSYTPYNGENDANQNGENVANYYDQTAANYYDQTASGYYDENAANPYAVYPAATGTENQVDYAQHPQSAGGSHDSNYGKGHHHSSSKKHNDDRSVAQGSGSGDRDKKKKKKRQTAKTTNWFCCQCDEGPYNGSIAHSCVNYPCNHTWCRGCPLQEMQEVTA